jgi:GTPase SAR1 family protein
MGCSCSYLPEGEEPIKFDSIRFKVLITGLKKVGKTSILQSAWWDNPEKLQTNSCLCYSKKVNIRGNSAFIDIWDSALVSSTYFVDMNILILVVDLSNSESLNIDMEKVKGFSNNIIVAGNKFDISQGENFRSAKLLAKQLSGFFVPISVTNGFGIKDLWELVIYLISS